MVVALGGRLTRCYFWRANTFADARMQIVRLLILVMSAHARTHQPSLGQRQPRTPARSAVEKCGQYAPYERTAARALA